MLLVRRGTVRWAMIAGITSLRPGNASLPIGDAQTANREIGVPGIQPLRFVPRVQLSLALTADTNH